MTQEQVSSNLFDAARVDLDENEFFKLPSIEPSQDERVDKTIAQEDVKHAPTESVASIEDASDLWIGLDKVVGKPPEHRTWEAFASMSSTTTQAHLVSEAGPAVYDALLCWSIDPLQLKNADVPTVESGAYFSSLLASALGQESIFFHRDDKRQTFTSALPTFRISGYSRDILQGLEKQCLSCGTMILHLHSFVQSTYVKRTTRCGIALASALDQILKVVQQHVAVNRRQHRSLLQLQSTIKGLLDILEPFQKLTLKLRRGYTDEDVLSIVFHQAYSIDYGEEQLREIMREVLRRVSQPWIEFLEEWIGTRREEGIPFTKSNEGDRRGFVKVEAQTYTDDFGQEIEEVDFRLDEDKMPLFMPDDIAKSIFETGKNLRFIRTCHPEHPLAKPDLLSRVQPPKAGWLYDWDAIQQLEDRVATYRRDLLAAIQKTRDEAQSLPGGDKNHSLFSKDVHQLEFFGVEEQQIEQRILASIDHLNQPLTDDTAEDALGRIVRQRLSGAYQSLASDLDFAPHWSLLPVLSFGGIASAQSQIINQESLRLLFSNHGLRSHLRMHREFHLFGNGMFSSRLSHALFDPDLETAERQAGVARQGGVMGLRLGGRGNWPPASSELRLALMGVLADSFGAGEGLPKQKLTGISRDSSELPGDMSFAVRDLSQEEIDKCMDPDCLEALDFLRLSYKAPEALAPIITPVILMQYDRIFKLLLKILRMVYVVDQLFLDVNGRSSRWKDPGDVSYRFTREAHHFVHGVASYFLNTGVAIPWQAFENRLDKIESYLNSSDATKAPDKVESPDRLREFHSQVLDRIMLTLFLRKRQQPVLKLLEEIFSLVLHYAKHSRMEAIGKARSDTKGQEAGRLYKTFKKKIQIFVTVCRGLTEKGPSSSRTFDDELGLKQDGIGDDNMVAQLLMKLDMCDYYTKH